MKTLNSIVLLIFAFTTTLIYSQSGSASDDNTTNVNTSNSSIRSIHSESLKYIEAFEEKGFEILRVEQDIILNEAKRSLRSLHKGVEYVIVVFGDKRIKDMHLTLNKFNVNTKQFERVKSDRKTDPFALVSVTPTQTTPYQFVIEVNSFSNSYDAAHYGLIVMRKN